VSTDLHGVVEDLVFVLLDVHDVLEHVVQLLLAEQRRLGRGGRLTLGRPLARVLVAAAADLVELGHPRAHHRLLQPCTHSRLSTNVH